MYCSKCNRDRLFCVPSESTTTFVAYECLSCGHRETEKRHNLRITDFLSGSYGWITAEQFVEDGWALSPKTVWTEGHTGHHNEDGGAIYRLVQVLDVEIQPDHNYRWTTFDFETCTIHHTTCWGSAPSLYIFFEEE